MLDLRSCSSQQNRVFCSTVDCQLEDCMIISHDKKKKVCMHTIITFAHSRKCWLPSTGGCFTLSCAGSLILCVLDLLAHQSGTKPELMFLVTQCAFLAKQFVCCNSIFFYQIGSKEITKYLMQCYNQLEWLRSVLPKPFLSCCQYSHCFISQ